MLFVENGEKKDLFLKRRRNYLQVLDFQAKNI